MGTINQEARERKAALKNLKAALKKADTALEKIERKLTQLTSGRKVKLPTIEDLDGISDLIGMFFGEIKVFQNVFNIVSEIFKIF